jgi:hypothetical protein
MKFELWKQMFMEMDRICINLSLNSVNSSYRGENSNYSNKIKILEVRLDNHLNFRGYIIFLEAKDISNYWCIFYE